MVGESDQERLSGRNLKVWYEVDPWSVRLSAQGEEEFDVRLWYTLANISNPTNYI